MWWIGLGGATPGGGQARISPDPPQRLRSFVVDLGFGCRGRFLGFWAWGTCRSSRLCCGSLVVGAGGSWVQVGAGIAAIAVMARLKASAHGHWSGSRRYLRRPRFTTRPGIVNNR